MKQITMDSDIPLLPQDVITNILIRLSVRSLIRFQCVCKSWKYLFKTPCFIADHLHHSTHHNPSLLLECCGERLPLHLLLLDHKMQVTELLDAPLIDSPLSHQFVKIVDSYNGLLCVQLIGKKSHSLVLLNPATKQIRRVPKDLTCSQGERFYVGFGFSPIVNDYKIVRIYWSTHHVSKVEVYLLSTGSWKEVEFGNLDGVALQYDSFATNGAIFWRGLKDEGENHGRFIVSFDIAMEVFTLIPVPAIALTMGAGFTMYEHKLAILNPNVTADSQSSLIEMWVMEEGTIASGEKWSWTKKYTSRPYLSYLYSYTIWRNEIVSTVLEGDVDNDETKIVLCNLTTNEFKMLDICICDDSFWVSNYVESLVPVDNIHIEEP